MTDFIYALCDPDTEEVRYIGKAKDINVRLRKHVYEAERPGESHRLHWIRSLLSQGKRPVVAMLEQVRPGVSWQAREQWWISLARERGCSLTNGTGGGEGKVGYIASEETKEKIRQAALGRKDTEETKEKKRQAMLGNQHTKGYKPTAEAVEKTRQANLGHEVSEETREKIRQARLGHEVSEKTREKLRQANLGKKHAREAKEKVSRANLGKRLTEETREKIRQANLGNQHARGHRHTEETKEKIRQAALKYWTGRRTILREREPGPTEESAE